MESKVLTLNELSRLLRVHEQTIYRRIKAGDLPAFKVGRSFRFHSESIEAWVKARTIYGWETPKHT